MGLKIEEKSTKMCFFVTVSHLFPVFARRKVSRFHLGEMQTHLESICREKETGTNINEMDVLNAELIWDRL